MRLEIREVRKYYGRKKVLEKITLTAETGQCTGIVGANGCGKSTLLRILAGAERADGGSILLDGKEIKNPRDAAEHIGYIPQESVLIPELTVRDNFRLWMGFGDCGENLKNLEKLCGQFEIRSFYREKVKNLSGGMRKRAGIVCALIHNPALLLMDEPSASLDLVFKEELKGYITEFTQKGGSVVLCSHDAGELALCRSLWAIKDGMAYRVPEKMTVSEMVAEYMR